MNLTEIRYKKTIEKLDAIERMVCDLVDTMPKREIDGLDGLGAKASDAFGLLVEMKRIARFHAWEEKKRRLERFEEVSK